MSKQMTLFLSESDLREVVLLLATQRDALFTDPVLHSPSAKITLMPESASRTVLVVPEWARNCLVYRKGGDGSERIDVLRSQSIEFDRPVSKDSFIRAGRLFYATDYLGDKGQTIPKPEEFLRWAERIFRLMKSRTSRDAALQAYVGSDAERMRVSGVELKSM